MHTLISRVELTTITRGSRKPSHFFKLFKYFGKKLIHFKFCSLFDFIAFPLILSDGAPGWACWEACVCRLLSVVALLFSAVFFHFMIFKLALLGHSYVRDLASLEKSEITFSGARFTLNYFSVPGATFSTFNSNENHFENLKAFNLDCSIVIP